jgi:AAA+ ATPase superfamily predicted ATPase
MEHPKVLEFIHTLCSGLDLPVPDQKALISSGSFFLININTQIPFANTRLPVSLPIFLPQKKELTQIDFDELRRLFSSKVIGGDRIGLLISMGNDEQFEKLSAICRAQKEAYAFDILPLGKMQLLELLASKKPHLSFKRLVLSQVNLKTVSPFTVTGPSPENVFFGREKEIYQILHNIEKTSFAIVGGRRIGKTSILSNLYRSHFPKAGYYSIFLDCQRYKTSEDLLNTYLRLSTDGIHTEKLLLKDLSNELQHTPLIILLDETDKLLQYEKENGWPLFQTLRAFTNTAQISVIISGERVLRSAIRNPDSPFFNFVNEISLGPIDFNAVYELVTLPMKQLEIDLLDEKEIVQNIYEFTSGHPNIVQRICDRLIDILNQRGNRILSTEDVDTVITDPTFQRDDFLGTYWERATPLEKIISLVMAEDKSLHTLNDIKENLQKKSGLKLRLNDVDEALMMLVNLRSILRHSEFGYGFVSDVFPKVISGTITYREMLALEIEKYREESLQHHDL